MRKGLLRFMGIILLFTNIFFTSGIKLYDEKNHFLRVSFI